MFCPMCGAPNEDDSIFCGNCGAALEPDALPAEVEGSTAEESQAGEPLAATADKAGDEFLADEPPNEAPSEDEFFLDEPQAEVLAPPPPPAYQPSPRAAAAGVPTSGLAIASLVLGIGGLTLLPLLGSIVAIVFGYMARNDIRKRPGEVTGEGLATAGIVLGWISIGLSLLGILFLGGFTVCGLCGAVAGG
jgi:hypothetical protein